MIAELHADLRAQQAARRRQRRDQRGASPRPAGYSSHGFSTFEPGFVPAVRAARGRRAALVVVTVLALVVVVPRLWWWASVVAGVIALGLIVRRGRVGGARGLFRFGAVDVTVWLIAIGAPVVASPLLAPGTSAGFATSSAASTTTAALDVAVVGVVTSLLARVLAKPRPGAVSGWPSPPVVDRRLDDPPTTRPGTSADQAPDQWGTRGDRSASTPNLDGDPWHQQRRGYLP